MNEEELERTGMIEKVIDDEVTVEERLEEILDKLEYIDFPMWMINEIVGLIGDIKKAKTNEKKEKIFFELLDLMED